MNLIVNSSDEYKIEKIDGEITSTNGRVILLGMEIPPYPKLLHLPELNKGMIAQKKVNGYNVRLTYMPALNNFIAVLRGGYACAKTTFLLRKHFKELFANFFKDNPNLILCMEVIGKKSMANLHSDYFKENYGFDEVGYFVFDIMDLKKPEDERFTPFEELKKICEKYGLNLIPVVGVIDNIENLHKEMKEISSVFEGVVMKSQDGREIFKYRFDDRKDLFADKIPKEKEKREMPPEEIITAHFFQGYEEMELGLESGISQEEMNQYQKMLDEMTETIKKDKTKIGSESNRIAEFLLDCLNKHGTFEEEMLKKIEKLFRQKVGREVGRVLKAEKKI